MLPRNVSSKIMHILFSYQHKENKDKSWNTHFPPPPSPSAARSSNFWTRPLPFGASPINSRNLTCIYEDLISSNQLNFRVEQMKIHGNLKAWKIFPPKIMDFPNWLGEGTDHNANVTFEWNKSYHVSCNETPKCSCIETTQWEMTFIQKQVPGDRWVRQCFSPAWP